MLVDAFIDLTSSDLSDADIEAAVAHWRDPEQLGALGGSVTVASRSRVRLPANMEWENWSFIESSSPVPALNASLELAGARGAALLILIGRVDARTEAVALLRRALEHDPMFGFIIPRLSCRDGCCIARLTRNGLPGTEWVPRAILAELPERLLLVETASPCILVAPQITGNFGPVDSGFADIRAALLDLMAVARRCGFRTVSCTRAVVSLDGLGCDSAASATAPSLPTHDRDLLSRAVPDLERSWDEFGGRSAERFESLFAALPAVRRSPKRPSLLVDIRNVAPVHNGTSHAVLGLVSAFKEFTDRWSISLVATEEGTRFHRLREQFAGWPLHTTVPDDSFTVAFRPTQPWHIQELVDLHHAALINVCLLLDTISWDIAYCAPPHLDAVWQFLATYTDGLLYDSEFTRQRFLNRFPAATSIRDRVTHFSFDPADYVQLQRPKTPPDEDYILVVGNHLDHKDVRQTVRTVAAAFPYRHVRVLGPAGVLSPLVSAWPSGMLPDEEIHALYAGASYVIYPSFYEGFGFPLLIALAYGRTVLVRRSALVDELAQFCHGTGRLVTYDRREELAELIGRLSEGLPVASVRVPMPRRGTPRRWRDAALDTLEFLAELARNTQLGRWRARDRTIGQLMSYRS